MSKRIRALSTASPIDVTSYLALDSPAFAGSRKAALKEAVEAALAAGTYLQVSPGDAVYLLEPLSMEGFELFALGHPSNPLSATPRARTVRDVGTGASDTLVVADLGKTVRYARVGAVAVTLPDLSAGWTSGTYEEHIDFIFADAATDVTFTLSGAGVKLNESTSPWARGASAGRVRFSSIDGKRWYR